MRYCFGALLLLVALTGCQCGSPLEPTPVTFRVKNATSSPIWVDESAGLLGLTVRRRVGGEWVGFVERPACECLSCDVVCDAPCACDDSTSPFVLKLAPGQTKERVWGGVVQVSGRGPCGGFFPGPECLRAENPPVNESFQLQLCYALAAPGVAESDAGLPVPGALNPDAVVCVEREFQVQDGEVELSPRQGMACQSHTQCVLPGELCFGGVCSSTCPANEFPVVGAGWQVRIAEPDDQGFFTVEETADRTVYRGTGKVGSVTYQSGTMTLRMTRPAPGGGELRGAVYVTLPGGLAAPVFQGEELRVLLVDASTDENGENRALVVRDSAGELVLAADHAQLGQVLGPEDTAPFTVRSADKAVGCLQDQCGKQLFSSTLFESMDGVVELAPGASVEKVAVDARFMLMNVGNGRFAKTRCPLQSLMPYAIAQQRTQ